MKRTVFLGRIASDIETRQTQGGKSVANFSIAIDSGYGDNKRTDFFNLVAFEKSAENIAKFFGKGNRIALECEPQQNVWTDKEGKKHYDVNFVVRAWEFCDSAKSRNEEPKQGVEAFMAIPDEMEQELPFV